MTRKKTCFSCLIALIVLAAALSSCSGDSRTALRVIIIPKIEISEIEGDFPGEAQPVRYVEHSSR